MSDEDRLAFQKGDVLFRQGDPSDRVLRILQGEIEIVREVGAMPFLLGHAREGEWLGEMGVIENRPRSATARATSDGAVESMTGAQFLARVSREPTLAHELILRLSVRLKRIEDRIAGDLLPVAPTRRPERQRAVAEAEAPAEPVLPADVPGIVIAGRSPAMRAQLGVAPLEVTELPFVVGRVREPREALPPQHPILLLQDQKPFRLSRDHFMVARRGARLIVSDLGSTLGTIVNGRPIGVNFMSDAAPLRPGDNHIIAGGHGSPFEFTVTAPAS